jgi:hypothetical protein
VTTRVYRPIRIRRFALLRANVQIITDEDARTRRLLPFFLAPKLLRISLFSPRAAPILLQIHGRSSPLNRRAADLVVGGAAGLLWGAESVSRTRGSSRPSARFRPIRGGEEASATASCSASSPRRSTGGTLLVLRFRTPAPLTWFDFVR